MTTFKKISVVVLSLFLIFGFTTISDNPNFVSNHLKNIFSNLPKEVQVEIAKKNKDFLLDINSHLRNQQIRVEYNKNKDISQLGIFLETNNPNDNYLKEEHKFIETFILYTLFSKSDLQLSNYIEYYHLEALNKKVKIDSKDISKWKEVAKAFSRSKIDIKYFDKFFYAIGDNGYVIKFPSNINLVKGMNKDELENAFINSLLEKNNLSRYYHLKRSSRIDKVENNSLLYIIKGDKFGTDDFRNDIYLTMDNSKFRPIFSNNFPKESFSNLFISDLNHHKMVEATFILYGQNKYTRHLSIDTICRLLENHTIPYTATSEINRDSIKGTIMYHDPTYNYVHMMLTESNRRELFSKDKSSITATIYLYIPKENLQK